MGCDRTVLDVCEPVRVDKAKGNCIKISDPTFHRVLNLEAWSHRKSFLELTLPIQKPALSHPTLENRYGIWLLASFWEKADLRPVEVAPPRSHREPTAEQWVVRRPI